MAYKWSDNDMLLLLDLYRDHPCLWNTKIDGNRLGNKKQARSAALEEIVRQMGKKDVSVVDLNSKIRFIRSRYSSELVKILKSEKNGAGMDNVYKPRLKWFQKADLFLRSVYRPRIVMLADKEAKTVLSKQSPDQSTFSATQTNTTEKRTKTNNQANRNEDDQSVANFGWEQIENGPLLPFVKRGSEDFVAWYIVIEKVCRNITSVFSREMLYCISFEVCPMFASEARAFNEININHCDKNFVGSHLFRQGDAMVSLESVKKFVEYFHACRNLTVCGKKGNHLFGFIRINGQNEVPFVWHGNNKLVPLFYFEGIEAKVINLTDPWKIGYLKFCFKMQRIRQQLYYETPVKVVDFKDVEAHFPAGSTFELSTFKNFNRELLAPVQTDNTLRKRPAGPSTEVNAKQARICLPDSESTRLIQPNQTRTTKQLEKPRLATVDVQPVRPPRESQYATITPVNCQASTAKRINSTKNLQDLATITLVPQQETAEPKDDRIIQPQQGPGARNEVFLIRNQNLGYNPKGFNDQVATKRLQQLVASSGVSAPMQKIANVQQTFNSNRPTAEYHITNVPRSSPQVASSPGDRQTSPFMTAATEAVQIHSQSNNLMLTGLPSEPVRQTYVSNNNYPPAQGSQLHREQFGHHQMSGNVDLPQTHFLQQSSTAHPVRSNSAGQKPQTLSPQVGQFHEMPHHMVNRSLSNSSLVDHPGGSTGVHQLVGAPGCLPVPLLQASLQEIAVEKKVLMQNIKRAKAIQVLQRHIKKNSIPEGYSPGSNNHQVYENNSFSAPEGFQNGPSEGPPPTYQQQYATPNTPLVQNVVVAESNVHNYLPESATSVSNITNKTALKLTVLDHILNIDTYVEQYTVKYCPLRDVKLLGIRMSLVTNDYLVNFSEFAKKILLYSHSENLYRLVSTFKTLYKLNPVQQERWDQAIKEKYLKFDGFFKDIFVEYNETVSVLTCLVRM